MVLNQEQSDEVFEAMCEKFEKFNATAEDMLSYLANILVGTLAKNGVTKKNAFKYFEELKRLFIDIQRDLKKRHKPDPFLDHLQSVFDENDEALKKAFQCMKDNPNEDGKLFSKELRERMSKFGDMDVTDSLKNKDFWKEMCAHAGMSEEEFERIGK